MAEVTRSTSLRVEGLSKCYRTGRRDLGIPVLRSLARRADPAEHSGAPLEVWALRDLSFSVEPGTILGVVGPNGAGKTTLLKILARITPPTEGRVVGRGRVVSLLEAGLGFQPDLSGRENVFLNAALYGLPRSEVLARFDEIVAFAGLEAAIDLPLGHYSSGMYSRLAFSVALNMEPEILLADEVLAVGDLDFHERCLRRVEEAGEQGMTVLFVSHDMAAVTRLCDRAIWLRAGELVASGEAGDVVEQYESSVWNNVDGDLRSGVRGRRSHRYGEILSIRLLSAEGREIGTARTDEDVHVEVGFRVSRRGCRARCAVQLLTRGASVFGAMQPEELRADAAGRYVTSLRVPGGLLAPTRYAARVGLHLRYRSKEVRLHVDDALAFQVYDPAEAEIPLSARYRGLDGVVRPRLEWSAVRRGDAGADGEDA